MQGRRIETTTKFDKELKRLSKGHHGLKEKVETILERLATNKIPAGDRLIGYDEHELRKIRCGTGTKGTKGGARIIYYKDGSKLVPLTIYLKSNQVDVSRQMLINLLVNYLSSRPE